MTSLTKAVDVISVDELLELDLNDRETPLVIKNCDIGQCVNNWSIDYLQNTCGSKKVVVHESNTPQLDFRAKNFKYVTIPFNELITNCSQQPSGENNKFCYLRSLGDDPRGKDISDLSKHFPELYKDLCIPKLFPQESFFSSVFRITSPKLQLWTHYDTCHNILIQICGRKRVVFFPPSEAQNLYLDGDKSKVIEIDNPDTVKYPKFQFVERYETVLEPGDIIFIPALWFHNITAIDFSISVNVFWKNLDTSLYDKKDTYGNRDLIPAQLGFRTLDKAVEQLKNLPTKYHEFYLRRMIISLENRLTKLSKEED